jgi:ubiquinone/menaquinone biosynthesis C-methylase UbiE
MDVTQRFTDRADFYHAHRPRYPKELITLLVNRCALSPKEVIADVGSGTGILSELFLAHGNRVFAVEPNAPMRAIAERNLGNDPRFLSVNGTAEATTLADASVDYVTAAQAFHWFDRARTEVEFARILKPGGWIVLVWNERLVDTSPFARAYEDLLIASSIDYVIVDPKHVSADAAGLDAFLRKRGGFAAIRHSMIVTFEQLTGFLSSASYAPLPGHPKYATMMVKLREIFAGHERKGTVSLDFEMKVYYGRRFDPSER